MSSHQQAPRPATRHRTKRPHKPRNESDAMAERHARLWKAVRGPFLCPQKFPGHTCEWEPFSYVQAGCRLCGAEHRCAVDNPDCVLLHHDEGHTLCEITGCVLRETTLHDEWAASERACPEPPAKRQAASTEERPRPNDLTTRKRAAPGASRRTERTADDPCIVWNFVNDVIQLILQSPKSKRSIHNELERLCCTQTSLLQKELRRQLAERGSVNLVDAASVVAWHTRKMRRPALLDEVSVGPLVKMCTDAVTHVLLKYGTQGPSRLLQNETRKREFACSMLYLMRSGVECRGQCILPRVDVMQKVLPLETCLPDTFGIRSKSITEGENLLKLEIRRARAAVSTPTLAGRLSTT